MKYTCPACGYKTLGEERGWDICCVCRWEDDAAQLQSPGLTAGANRGSLWDWQHRPFAEPVLYERDPLWRPLRIDEAPEVDLGPDGYFAAVCNANPIPYWLA